MNDFQKPNFKIKVKNIKESKEVQTIAFELGYSWSGNDKKFRNLDKPFLFLDTYSYMSGKHEFDGRYLYYMEKTQIHGFLEDIDKEITLEQLRDKNFQKRVRKLLILEALEDKK